MAKVSWMAPFLFFIFCVVCWSLEDGKREGREMWESFNFLERAQSDMSSQQLWPWYMVLIMQSTYLYDSWRFDCQGFVVCWCVSAICSYFVEGLQGFSVVRSLWRLLVFLHPFFFCRSHQTAELLCAMTAMHCTRFFQARCVGTGV